MITFHNRKIDSKYFTFEMWLKSILSNLEMISGILGLMELPNDVISFVADRLGHDRRYAMDASKLAASLGWEPLYRFEDALQQTVKWYIDNEEWWRRVKRGDYLKDHQLVYS